MAHRSCKAGESMSFMYVAFCVGAFLLVNFVSAGSMTVFYHRGWAHRGLEIEPRVEKFMIRYGKWITGMDPKAWVCMHRMHHAHSDTALDPHSPKYQGVFGLFLGQLNSYKRTLFGLGTGQKRYTKMVQDLDFDISWLNRRGYWWAPYALHTGIGAAIGLVSGAWLLGAAWTCGMLSHPVGGWMVNSFGHAWGGRNFETKDNSRNNHLAAWAVFGEGFQNNHHQHPSSAKLSYRWYEIDHGYWLCLAFERIGWVKIHQEKLIPRPGDEVSDAAEVRQAA